MDIRTAFHGPFTLWHRPPRHLSQVFVLWELRMSRQQRLGIILVTTTPQPPAPHARPCRSSSLPRVPAMAYRYLRRTKADCAFRGGNACQGIVANGLLSVVRTHAKRVQVIFACVSTAFLLKCTAFRLQLRQYLSPAFPLPSFSKALTFACDYGNTFRLRFHCLPSQRRCLSLATLLQSADADFLAIG